MATTPSTLVTLSAELSALARTAAPSVVTVAARPHRTSSGVVLGGGFVLTADHAIERDHEITVLVDGERRSATLAGRDTATDLAVLLVEGLTGDGPPVGDVPAAGALVLSLSRTGAGTLSTGLGVITSVGGPLRTARGAVLPSIVRTDAAMRPGTAGGALVDMEGRVVGITTPGLLRGLPVALPAVHAFELGRRLAMQQPLGRGYLGVNVQPVTLAAAQRTHAADGRGLLVFGVASGGAAEAAGVLVGDILVRYDDAPVAGAEDLQDRLGTTTPGATAILSVVRGDALRRLEVTVGERPER